MRKIMKCVKAAEASTPEWAAFRRANLERNTAICNGLGYLDTCWPKWPRVAQGGPREPRGCPERPRGAPGRANFFR
eukprot:8328292-Karenia_brevis.AAC.1